MTAGVPMHARRFFLCLTLLCFLGKGNYSISFKQ